MSLEEQLEHIKQEYPEAWEYMQSPDRLPKYDDNDELVAEED